MLPSISFISIFILLIAIIVILLIMLAKRNRAINKFEKTISNLEATIQELDQQAKLIIKADMELKLYQEEVSDKLKKLNLLKSLIYSSINILDKEKLLAQIDEKMIHDIGFAKGLLLQAQTLNHYFNHGFTSSEIVAFSDFLLHHKDLFKTTSILSAEVEVCRKLCDLLQANDFIIAAIKINDQVEAFFVVAKIISHIKMRRAEKEILSIICIYLGQCLNNIALFEDLYRIKDTLEKNVKERTTELIKTMREIEKISKLKSNFISSVSHELRTPLTSIKGFSALLVEEKFGKLPEEAKERLKKIDVNVDKLVAMINTLLDIGRIESGKMEIKIAPYNISTLIKEVSEFLAPQMQEKEILIAFDVSETVFVYMDKHLIEQALINLLNNAIKFSQPRSKIVIQCKVESPRVIIAISDNGCGIPETDKENIFQEFFRAHNSVNAKVKGSGLGLSLVKHIIDLHQGKLWFTSEEGKGTTFFFTLKLYHS